MTDYLDLDLLGMTGIDPLIPRSPLTKLTSLKLVIPVINLSPQWLGKMIPLRVSLTMTPIKLIQLQLEVKIRTFNHQPQIRPVPVSPIIIHQIPAAQPSRPVLLGVEPNQE